ncbi:MAG: hypothetical protein ABH823_05325 [bacterium]
MSITIGSILGRTIAPLVGRTGQVNVRALSNGRLPGDVMDAVLGAIGGYYNGLQGGAEIDISEFEADLMFEAFDGDSLEDDGYFDTVGYVLTSTRTPQEKDLVYSFYLSLVRDVGADQAAGVLERMQEVEPDDWAVLTELGKAVAKGAEGRWQRGQGSRAEFERAVEAFTSASRVLPETAEARAGLGISDDAVAEARVYERKALALCAVAEIRLGDQAERQEIGRSLMRYYQGAESVDAALYGTLAMALLKVKAPLAAFARVFCHGFEGEPTINHKITRSMGPVPLRLVTAVRHLESIFGEADVTNAFAAVDPTIREVMVALSTFFYIERRLAKEGPSVAAALRETVDCCEGYISSQVRHELDSHVVVTARQLENDQAAAKKRHLRRIEESMLAKLQEVWTSATPVTDSVEAVAGAYAESLAEVPAEFQEAAKERLLWIITVAMKEQQHAHLGIALASRLFHEDRYFRLSLPMVIAGMLRGDVAFRHEVDGVMQEEEVDFRAIILNCVEGVARDVYRAAKGLSEAELVGRSRSAEFEPPATEREFALLASLFDFFFVDLRETVGVRGLFKEVEMPYGEPISLQSFCGVFYALNVEDPAARLVFLRRAIELDDNNVTAKTELARALMEQGDEAGYRSACAAALDTGDKPLVEMRLATLEMWRNNREKRRTEAEALVARMKPLYEAALQQYPGRKCLFDDWVSLAGNLFMIYLAEGRHYLAGSFAMREIHETILAGNEEVVIDWCIFVINEFSAANDYAEAVRFVDLALQLRPGTPELVSRKLYLLSMLGRDGYEVLEPVGVDERLVEDQARAAHAENVFAQLFPAASDVVRPVFAQAFTDEEEIDEKGFRQAAKELREQGLDHEMELAVSLARLIGTGNIYEALALFLRYVGGAGVTGAVRLKTPGDFIATVLTQTRGDQLMAVMMSGVYHQVVEDSSVHPRYAQLWDQAVSLERQGFFTPFNPVDQMVEGRTRLMKFDSFSLFRAVVARRLEVAVGREPADKAAAADIANYKRMIELDPGYFWTYRDLAQAYSQQGNHVEACIHLEQALKKAVKTPGERLVAHAHLKDHYAAYCLQMRQAKPDVARDLEKKAIAHARKAIELAEGDEAAQAKKELADMFYGHHALTHGYLAVYFASGGKLDEAEEHYEKAVAAAANGQVSTLLALGVLIAQAPQFDQGYKAFVAAYQQDSTNLQVVSRLIELTQNSHDFESALFWLDRASELMTDNKIGVAANRIFALISLDRFEEAYRDGLALVGSLGGTTRAEDSRSYFYAHLNTAAAARSLRNRSNLPADQNRYRNDELRLYGEAYRFARENGFGNDLIQNVMWGLAAAQPDLAQAEELCVTALKLGNDSELQSLLIRVLAGQGKYDEALNHLSRIHLANPGSIEILTGLAALAEAGDEAWVGARRFVGKLPAEKRGFLAEEKRQAWLLNMAKEHLPIPESLQDLLTAHDRGELPVPKPLTLPSGSVAGIPRFQVGSHAPTSEIEMVLARAGIGPELSARVAGAFADVREHDNGLTPGATGARPKAEKKKKLKAGKPGASRPNPHTAPKKKRKKR